MTTSTDLTVTKRVILTPVVKKSLVIALAVAGTIGAVALAFAAANQNSDDTVAEDSE
jgi:hypothetical protein